MKDHDVKYVPDPAAWPGNGPPWLFEDSTPEEIAHMQQLASDAAVAAEIAAQTPTGIDQIDATTGGRLHATFYEHRVFGHPEPCGVVTLENGVAQIPPELDFINTTSIYDRNDERLLMPADGAAFIEALPYTFKNAYMWAEVES
jgi:hypothetical protein